MNKKLQFTLLLSMIVLLTSFTKKTKEKKTLTYTASFGVLKATFKAPSGKVYFFTDKKYYRYNINSDRLEKTAVIQGNWKGLVNGVNATLVHTNGKAYFFKGNKYYRYNFYTKKVDKVATIGKDGWKGVPSNIDAAVVHTNGKAYFFKGSKYYRYNSTLHKVDKIAEISKNWKGVPNNVEAVLRHTNGKIYFFKGNKYYRYSIAANKVDKVGTIGVHGWKGLSFSKELKNATASTKNNIRLKVTLTRIKSIQARDSDDIADFAFWQWINYKTKGKKKGVLKRKIKVLSKDNIDYEKPPIRTKNSIVNSSSMKNYKQIHVREGDERNFINNSIIFEISPQEAIDKRAEFSINTILIEISGSSLLESVVSFGNNVSEAIIGWNGIDVNGDNKEVSHNNNYIEVNIYEVLDYLQNPNRPKYGKSYFRGGRAGNMHEYGAYGDVMWFKKGSNNSLIGHLEFGDNKKETYVRFYYRFELVP
jgi:hypothetical protein